MSSRVRPTELYSLSSLLAPGPPKMGSPEERAASPARSVDARLEDDVRRRQLAGFDGDGLRHHRRAEPVSALAAHDPRAFVEIDLVMAGVVGHRQERRIAGDLAEIDQRFGRRQAVRIAREREQGDRAGERARGRRAKGLLRETRSEKWFGIAIAGGVVAPTGVGAFRPVSWDPFAYLALSRSFLADDLLLHANPESPAVALRVDGSPVDDVDM